jgi:sortase A
MTNRSPNKLARWIGNVLILAGTIAVGIWACSWLGMTIWQRWQNHAFDQRRAVPQVRTQTHIENGAIVGRLAIPRLHVRAIVREGDSDRTLSIAAGHIPGTAFPGHQGNVGIAGHRDGLFRGLKGIAANDKITLETPQADYVYSVESTQIVKPERIDVLNPGSARELTLVTCYPFEYVGSAPDRFIVKARLVSQEAAENDIHEPAPVHRPVMVHQPVMVHEPVIAKPKPPARNEIAFDIPQGHSRELVPGKIWFGVSSADPGDRIVNGWVWVMPERRTVWLRDVEPRQPVTFYQDGEKRELVITSVARTSAHGYLTASR